jgi:XRE family aerobic/anaerobic benzoate catabolism transcriptional regulator
LPVKSEVFLQELGHRLRDHRKLRGLSQEQLGQLAHLSTRYISQIESGRGNLSIPLHEILQPNKWQPIVALIGLRGAGKSSVGRELAGRTAKPFVELDGLIEDEVGMSLAEIFVLHGEGYYRRLEREVLTRFLASSSPAILATGGSLVTDRATFDLLKKNTITIWLRARPELHLLRVSAQGDRRPMAGRADPLAELRTLLDEREPLYAEADITIDTSLLSTARVASEAERRLGDWKLLR